MSSILTNNSAMTALSTLRGINNNLADTQNRISTGLKVSSGKDNAAAFAISETMKGDNGMLKGIKDGLTQTTNSLSVARLGAENVLEIGNQINERVARAVSASSDADRAVIQAEIDDLVIVMTKTAEQARFNGQDLYGTDAVDVVTGVKRDAGAVTATKITFNKQDLVASAIAKFDAIDVTTAAAAEGAVAATEVAIGETITIANNFALAESKIELQQNFLDELTTRLDSGVASMVDANMEEEAARLQSLQVQQQLATQSLSIANQAPQNILSLFR